MEGSKQVLVKVMLFQLREDVHPQDGAMLTFFHKWSSPLLVLSIDVSFVLKFFWKGDKNLKNWTSGPIYMEDPVKFLQHADIFSPQSPCKNFWRLCYKLFKFFKNQIIYPKMILDKGGKNAKAAKIFSHHAKIFAWSCKNHLQKPLFEA